MVVISVITSLSVIKKICFLASVMFPVTSTYGSGWFFSVTTCSISRVSYKCTIWLLFNVIHECMLIYIYIYVL